MSESSNATNHERRIRELEKTQEDLKRRIKSLEATVERIGTILGQTRQMVEAQ